MRLTHKIAAALIGVLAALLVGAAFILDGAVRPGVERLEQTLHQRNQARVAANLAEIADDVRARVADYAYWDDTYAFVDGRDESYTNDFNGAWINEYGVDVVVFADSSGRPLWHRVVSDSGAIGEDAALAAQLVALATSRPSGRATRVGVVWTPQLGFVVVALAQATRSDGGGTPRGWVMMGKRLRAASLSQQTQLRIELIGAAAPRQDLAPRMRQIAEADPYAAQTWESGDAVFALSAMRDPFGRLSGAVLTQQPRDMMAFGARSINLALLLFAGAFTVAIAALWLLLRGLVIGRLERFEAHIRAQRGEPRAMLPPGGDDEISRLTQAYNALVARLSDEGAREEAALMRREAEAAANRMKADFIANVSHELRRPLDAIIGYTELIGEELQGGNAERTRADLDRVTDAARRLLNLIGEILDIARIDAGDLELKPEAFHVAELVQALATSDLGATRIETLGPLGAAYTDQRRLRQCLANALRNAHYLSPQGPVVLRASRHGNRLRFEVQAPGVAFTPEQLAHALDPLSGEHKPTSRLIGSGLALVVNRKLLSLLGGALEVRASADGAAFVLTAAAVLGDDAPQLTTVRTIAA